MVSSVPVYVINLERSQDRWEQIKISAEKFAIDLHRIDAVEGKHLSSEDLSDFDEAGFRRWHGKIAMPAEIGCYFSHIRALEVIANSAEPYAVIVEDDVLFTPEFKPFLEKAMILRGWDAIKLVNHRVAAFRSFHKIDDQFSIGRCVHGPSGSSAAYIVSAAGAAKLLTAIKPMRLPYDVALERGWAGDYEIFTANRAVISLSGASISTIAQGRGVYAKVRLPAYKRLGTLLFRATDYIRRIVYACAPKNLKEGKA